MIQGGGFPEEKSFLAPKSRVTAGVVVFLGEKNAFGTREEPLREVGSLPEERVFARVVFAR